MSRGHDAATHSHGIRSVHNSPSIFSIRDGFSVREYEERMVCIGIKANYTGSCLMLYAAIVSLCNYIRDSTGVRTCLIEYPFM